MWWFGPKFLLRNKESWPENKFVSDVTNELHSDKKSNVAGNVEFIDHPKQKISAIMNINKYGSLIKVLKVSFYVLKFVNIIYQKIFKKPLKINNIFDSESLWLRDIQYKDIIYDVLLVHVHVYQKQKNSNLIKDIQFYYLHLIILQNV